MCNSWVASYKAEKVGESHSKRKTRQIEQKKGVGQNKAEDKMVLFSKVSLAKMLRFFLIGLLIRLLKTRKGFEK